jgi:hypothetical protein
MLLAVLYSLLVAVGRPCRCLCMPPSLSFHLSSHHSRPPLGPARPPCNYPFPISTLPRRCMLCFRKTFPGFFPSLTVDSLISDDHDMDGEHGPIPMSHPLDLDPHADEELHLDPLVATSTPPLHDHGCPSRLRSHPIRNGELVAHLSDHPRVADPEGGKATEDIVAQPDMASLITAPRISMRTRSHMTLPLCRSGTASNRPRTVPPSPTLKPPTSKLPCSLSMPHSWTVARGDFLTSPPIARSLIACGSSRSIRTHRVKYLALRVASWPKDAVNYVRVLTTRKPSLWSSTWLPSACSLPLLPPWTSTSVNLISTPRSCMPPSPKMFVVRSLWRA